MLKLSEDEIIARIVNGELFECESIDGGFSLKITAYSQTICTAIHAGSRFRPSLDAFCVLNEQERFYEEDPYTDKFIESMPMTVIGKDSRYEYDLNRPLATCVYKTAWGKEVWSKKLPERERQRSLEKHQCFYRVIDALVSEIERRFKSALIFDVHSYNYMRIDRQTPVFNIGTEQIDMERWQTVIESTINGLSQVSLKNVPIKTDCNNVFCGRGYMIAHINSRFANTLVIPLEIKKVYMNEREGQVYSQLIESLSKQLEKVFSETGKFFAHKYRRYSQAKSATLAFNAIDPIAVDIDTKLFKLAENLETLYYINPVNALSERKKFFKKNGNYEPRFKYKTLDIDPYLFRQSLYELPINLIRHPGLKELYQSVVDGLNEKIGLLVNVGKPNFVYESLKYYGQPTDTDLQNARFLLHANQADDSQENRVHSLELYDRFKAASIEKGMNCRIEINSKLIAKAMVSNSKKTVFLAKDIDISEIEAQALIEHELGVHMATTLNARMQPLKIFSLGLPGNTLTQEGLAILNEFQSGNMTLHRIKELALRVVAVNQMLTYGSFRKTYANLCEYEIVDQKTAFDLTLRVHRGGGLTKDYLYLNGFSQALYLSRSTDIRNLYVGKTSFSFLPIIDELVDQQIISFPQFCSRYLSSPVSTNSVLEFLINSIKPPKNTVDADRQKNSCEMTEINF